MGFYSPRFLKDEKASPVVFGASARTAVASPGFAFEVFGSMPERGSARRCLRRRSALGLNDAYVNPPDMAPPITGTILLTVLESAFLVRLTPIARKIFFANPRVANRAGRGNLPAPA